MPLGIKKKPTTDRIGLSLKLFELTIFMLFAFFLYCVMNRLQFTYIISLLFQLFTRTTAYFFLSILVFYQKYRVYFK